MIGETLTVLLNSTAILLQKGAPLTEENILGAVLGALLGCLGMMLGCLCALPGYLCALPSWLCMLPGGLCMLPGALCALLPGGLCGMLPSVLCVVSDLLCCTMPGTICGGLLCESVGCVVGWKPLGELLFSGGPAAFDFIEEMSSISGMMEGICPA
jgi:hypothetical protein